MQVFFHKKPIYKKPLVKIAEQPKKQPWVRLKSLKLKFQTFSELLILQAIFIWKLCGYFRAKTFYIFLNFGRGFYYFKSKFFPKF